MTRAMGQSWLHPLGLGEVLRQMRMKGELYIDYTKKKKKFKTVSYQKVAGYKIKNTSVLLLNANSDLRRKRD